MTQFTRQSLIESRAGATEPHERVCVRCCPVAEKEIRRIGGARYLPAEGGVFIGKVAELYGNQE